ncbi:MAG: ABC transporter permease [Anaerolineae bacterium]|nr:ABC transporter permease [Anaerolineae bacterium]MDX9831250.1 ABC transporter permease [Anaerolineae bacterium]
MNQGAELFLRSIVARAYPRVIGANREKSWVFFETLLPLLATAAYVFFYRALNAPEEYIGLVVVGGAMTAYWLNVLWSMSAQLYWDKDAGNLTLYIAAPSSLMAILLGMAVGGLLMTTTRAVAIIVAGWLLFGVQFSLEYWGLLLVTFVITMAALYGMGMLFASVFLLWGREAWHLSNLLQEPIYLASGFYFPVKALGFWAATTASLIPLTLGLDAMRQLLFPANPTFGFLSVDLEIGILVVLGVVFLVASKFALEYMERRAMQEGRLTERRR